MVVHVSVSMLVNFCTQSFYEHIIQAEIVITLFRSHKIYAVKIPVLVALSM